MRHAAIFSGFTAILLSMATIAQATPEKVYRFPLLAPQTIFVRGFIAPGHDRSFLRHASGNSVFSGDTMFISTSDSIHESRRMLQISLQRLSNVPHYLYVIRPTTDFYDMPRSLNECDPMLPEWRLTSARAHPLVSLSPLERADGTWPCCARTIHGAFRAQIINGSLILTVWTPNPHYLEANAEVNPDPMPLDDTVPAGGYVENGFRQGEFMSLSFSVGCDNMRLRASPKKNCESADRISLDDPVSSDEKRVIN